jgi:hypothetical protein
MLGTLLCNPNFKFFTLSHKTYICSKLIIMAEIATGLFRITTFGESTEKH